MTASPRTYPRLLPEAASLSTPGPRLAQLARHRGRAVAAMARRNPALPNESLRQHLGMGCPNAWGSAAAELLVFGDGVTLALQDGADLCLARTPAPPTLAARVARDRWATERDSLPMLGLLAASGIAECNRSRGRGGPLHRRAVRALCLAIRWSRTVFLCHPPHPDHDTDMRGIESWAFGGMAPLCAPAITLHHDEDETVPLLTQFEANSIESSFNVLLTIACASTLSRARRFRIPLLPDLADLLRLAIPDPTEGA